MIKGLYTSAMGMLMQEASLAITTNNLANVNTTGYKKEKITFEEFPNILEQRINDTKIADGQKFYKAPRVGRMGTGVILDRVTTDHQEGSMSSTGNATDFMIHGKSYFALQTPDGIQFTKDGQFHVNSDGYLTNKQGFRVLGYRGVKPTSPMISEDGTPATWLNPIKISTPLGLTVDVNGQMYKDNQTISQSLLSVSFKDTNQIEKVGHNNYKRISGEVLVNKKDEISQGYLEKSNINIVNEMVNMIKISRAYESNSKILTGIDELLGKAVNQIGTLR
ncbi:MAG: hypothetical protein COB02_08445 [Candidatus Cloacimonadota bacterium]|nr:MAG: hypothetical protein COB02_08445 [Candidatus Cloacimonadota bacterium]